jgi:hypothetical protein
MIKGTDILCIKTTAKPGHNNFFKLLKYVMQVPKYNVTDYNM